jgi:hypothetical protein
MTDVAEIGAPVSAALTAGLLLAAAGHLRALDLPCPTVSAILAATGATHSRAYELRDAILAALPSLQRRVGRPPAPPREPDPDVALALCREARTYAYDHAGSVTGGPERRRYSDSFRHFIVALRERHEDVPLETFAAEVDVPLGTLKDWLRAGTSDAPEVDDHVVADDDTPASAVVQTILAAWDAWQGGIGAFYAHVREELRIDYGRSLIDRILELHDRRQVARRRGRSPDERALRGAFQTFFAGAQWVGDGMTIHVTINGERFVFNLELMVDAHSGAWAGASVRDVEDSAAVTKALADGVATTGEAPLAVLLDNKPSNHTAEVDAALGDDTERIRATLFRPQNKAHCEGAFGLFSQAAPPLALFAAEPRELARQVLALVVQTFGRTLNHRPRRDRGGRTRVELYNDDVSAEDRDAARRALEERRKKQERARDTLLARRDGAVRALLDETFARLALADPEQHLRAAIARYPLDVIVDGVAIFEGKRRAGTLPAGVDARYLLGIVRNVGDQHEGLLVAVELLRARQEARDRLLAPLLQARDATRSATTEVRERVLRFVDLALAADRRIDRLFWLLTVADEIDAHAKADPATLITAAARRIHGTHRLPFRERQEAARVVVANVVPLR